MHVSAWLGRVSLLFSCRLLRQQPAVGGGRGGVTTRFLCLDLTEVETMKMSRTSYLLQRLVHCDYFGIFWKKKFVRNTPVGGGSYWMDATVDGWRGNKYEGGASTQRYQQACCLARVIPEIVRHGQSLSYASNISEAGLRLYIKRSATQRHQKARECYARACRG